MTSRYQVFLRKHRRHAQAAAIGCCRSLRVRFTLRDVNRFDIVCAFLSENPELLSRRGTLRTNSASYFSRIAARFFERRNIDAKFATPTTSPDEAVKAVLRIIHRYSSGKVRQVIREHQFAMSAENIIGILLEKYVASVMEPLGWVWCAGDLIRGVDFIRMDNNGKWSALQIKNRSNTENSSSSRVRYGTKIQKWFRSDAKTGKTKWENFPHVKAVRKLCERNFLRFVRSYCLQLRSKQRLVAREK